MLVPKCLTLGICRSLLGLWRSAKVCNSRFVKPVQLFIMSVARVKSCRAPCHALHPCKSTVKHIHNSSQASNALRHTQCLRILPLSLSSKQASMTFYNPLEFWQLSEKNGKLEKLSLVLASMERYPCVKARKVAGTYLHIMCVSVRA
jgi:hypothetical protein